MSASDSAGLIGVIVGGVIGVAGSLIPQLWNTHRAQKAARGIARAYISGMLNNIRGLDDTLKEYLVKLNKDDTATMKMFGGRAPDELQKVLFAHVGLLDPDIAGDVVKFTNLHIAFKVDLAAIDGGLLAKQKAVSFVEDNLKRLAELQKLGKSLVDRLN
jgi:hypothetical protein